MNIDIKGLSKEQLVDLQSQIEKQLKVNKFPPKRAICECWDYDEDRKTLMYTNGEGKFTTSANNTTMYMYQNYRVIEQGLTFSNEVITSKDFTEDIDKQLCLCWDDEMMPSFRAIDYKNQHAFKPTMTRDGVQFSHYRLCTTPYELMPQWAKDIVDRLED